MQGFMILAIIGTEKDTLVYPTKKKRNSKIFPLSYHRYRERQFSVLLNVKSDKVNGAWNVGQGSRLTKTLTPTRTPRRRYPI